MEGIKQIDVESNKDFGKDFMSATAEERTKLLNKLEEVVRNLTKKWIKG
jgi:mRNA-degrading endonuclease YafQ of YafQ-DinJ toxin-antitoxin module